MSVEMARLAVGRRSARRAEGNISAGGEPFGMGVATAPAALCYQRRITQFECRRRGFFLEVASVYPGGQMLDTSIISLPML